MMTQAHHTQEELALHAMQGFPVKKASSIQKHLQICSVCREGLADVCYELSLMGGPVERREMPRGARQRFMEKVAASATAQPKEVTAKVELMAAGSERRNYGAELAGEARKAPLAKQNTASKLRAMIGTVKRKTGVHRTPSIQKKALLHMVVADSANPAKKPGAKWKAKTAMFAVSRAVAARIAGHF